MSQVKRIHCAIRARPNTEKKPIYEIDGNKIMLKNDKTVEVHQFGMFLTIYSIDQIIENR